MSDIFISYATADREKAKALADALETHGWSVWWDRKIPPGRQFDEVIEDALQSAHCVIVLWSKSSVESSWVKTEASEAMQRNMLVPAFIEDVKLPLEFRRLQAADLSGWSGGPSEPQLSVLVNAVEGQISRSKSTGNSATDLLAEERGRTRSANISKPPNVDAAGTLPDRYRAMKKKPTLSIVGTVAVVAIVGSLIVYAASGGRGGKSETGQVLNEESKQQQTEAAQVEGQSKNGARWISDVSGCKVRDSDPAPNETITWSGSCLDGKASGQGILQVFVNGQKHGTLKGEMRAGEPYGVVVITNSTKGITYEGRIEKGKPAGKGILTLPDRTRIEAKFVEGKPSGKAVINYANGSRYEGEISDGKRNGKGVLTEASGRYEGDFVDDKFDGYGILTLSNGNRYEGDFRKGMANGKGILRYANGTRYAGDFVNGKFHGHGTIINTKGQRSEGNFISGQRVR